MLSRFKLSLMVLVVIALASSVAYAQSVVLGSTSEEVEQAYGPIQAYAWRGTLYAEPPVVSEGTVYAVYRRKDDLNEYEFRISYFTDNSLSNLHPTRRVSSITLLTDRPIVIRSMLARLGWARAFCSKKCRVQRYAPGREIILSRKTFLRPTEDMAIDIYLIGPDGTPVQDSLHDLDSAATVFSLAWYKFPDFPWLLNVKGDWQ